MYPAFNVSGDMTLTNHVVYDSATNTDQNASLVFVCQIKTCNTTIGGRPDQGQSKYMTAFLLV